MAGATATAPGGRRTSADRDWLWLGRPSVRVFAERRRPRLTADELRLLADLHAGLDLPADLDLYARGGGYTFAHMGQALLDGLERPLPPLDCAVLAYHQPDLAVSQVAGCYLAEQCPGEPAVFSVSEQGVGAAFTALRILQAMRRDDTAGEGAVFVLDQSTGIHYDPDTHGRAVRDAGVLLPTGPPRAEPADPGGRADSADPEEGAPGGSEDRVRLAFLGEEQVTDPAQELAAVVRRHRAAGVIVGSVLAEQLDPRWIARNGVHRGPDRHLCTSAWMGLAERWPLERPAVVADYEPHTGRLFLAGLLPGRQR